MHVESANMCVRVSVCVSMCECVWLRLGD